MAFQAPHTGQENKNRKILEQLEEEKKRLRMAAQAPHGGGGGGGASGVGGMGNSANLNPATPPPMMAGALNTGVPPVQTSSPLIGIHGIGGGDQQHMTHQQRAALQHAHANSVGYFITQDSSFGNLILPVLPRFDAKS